MPVTIHNGWLLGVTLTADPTEVLRTTLFLRGAKCNMVQILKKIKQKSLIMTLSPIQYISANSQIVNNVAQRC